MTVEFNRLQVQMDGNTDIIVRRDFSHPPARVWRAMTEPELIRQWMSGYDYQMTRCEIDLRVGGVCHWGWTHAKGDAFFIAGTFQALRAPHHMEHVEHMNGDMSSGSAQTTDLVARGTGTRMTVVMRYDSAEKPAAAIATGMTDGMELTYGNLEALLPGI